MVEGMSAKLFAIGVDHGTKDGDRSARVVVERLPNGHLRIVKSEFLPRTRREEFRGSTADVLYLDADEPVR